MKTSMIGKYATAALFSFSLIALNNCGDRSDSASDSSYKTEENGPASDLIYVASPPGGYQVLPGEWIPTLAVETMCFNGVDDDGDGFTDCEDIIDCGYHAECSQWGPPLEDIVNSDTLTVYPNGLIVPEIVAFLNSRSADDDDANHWNRSNFFAVARDCWIDPRDQDPYSVIRLGEPLVAGPDATMIAGPDGNPIFTGAIGPQLSRLLPIVFGPRAGLINECEPGTDLFEIHSDTDNGDGAGGGPDAPGDEDGFDHEIEP